MVWAWGEVAKPRNLMRQTGTALQGEPRTREEELEKEDMETHRWLETERESSGVVKRGSPALLAESRDGIKTLIGAKKRRNGRGARG